MLRVAFVLRSTEVHPEFFLVCSLSFFLLKNIDTLVLRVGEGCGRRD